MKQILKNTGKAVLFGLLILASLAVLSVIFIPKGNDKNSGIYTKTNHLEATAIVAEPENTIDVLFLGDSEVYSTYIPMQIWSNHGWTAYDLSTGSQRLYETVDFLKLALQTQSPKVVVLDTNCLFRRCTPEQCFFDMISEAVPAVKYHDRWKDAGGEDLTFAISNTYTSKTKGYVYRNQRVAVGEADTEPEEDTVMKAIPKMNYLYITEIVDICKENDIELILVTSPSVKNATDAKQKRCEQLSEKYNLPYIDLNDETGVPDNLCINWAVDSRDGGDHLNASGAPKVTTRMEDLLAGFDLPDHRQDEAYSAWNDCLADYRETVK